MYCRCSKTYLNTDEDCIYLWYIFAYSMFYENKDSGAFPGFSKFPTSSGLIPRLVFWPEYR